MPDLPSRASDAGPASPSCTCANRRGDPCRKHDSVPCALCGYQFLPEETVPCQGSDACTARICHDCKDSYRCDLCRLYACGEHVYIGDGRVCGICIKAQEPRTPEPDGMDDNRPLERMH